MQHFWPSRPLPQSATAKVGPQLSGEVRPSEGLDSCSGTWSFKTLRQDNASVFIWFHFHSQLQINTNVRNKVKGDKQNAAVIIDRPGGEWHSTKSRLCQFHIDSLNGVFWSLPSLTSAERKMKRSLSFQCLYSDDVEELKPVEGRGLEQKHSICCWPICRYSTYKTQVKLIWKKQYLYFLLPWLLFLQESEVQLCPQQ